MPEYTSFVVPGDFLIYQSPFDMHVAIYAGEINGHPYIVHSIFDPPSSNGIKLTLLKPPNNLEKIKVFRSRNSDLAQMTLEIMQQWSTDNVKFSSKRTDLWKKIAGLPCHSALNEKTFTRYHRLSHINRINSYYRALKMAARSKHTVPTHEGLHCTEAAILATQVAALMPEIHDPISDPKLPYTWISDKNSCLLDNYDYLSDEYKDYLYSLTSTDCYDIPHDRKPAVKKAGYGPSILAWRHEELISTFLDRKSGVVHLDAKITSPALLERYLEKSSEWMSLGYYQQRNPRPISPLSYIQWKLKQSVLKSVQQHRADCYSALNAKKSRQHLQVIKPDSDEAPCLRNKRRLLIRQIQYILSLKKYFTELICQNSSIYKDRNPFFLLDNVMYSARMLNKSMKQNVLSEFWLKNISSEVDVIISKSERLNKLLRNEDSRCCHSERFGYNTFK
jgi:hypothetical protein